MSIKEINSKIDSLAEEYLKVLEKVNSPEQKKAVFRIYYETLIILNDISVESIKSDKKLSKIID